MSLWSDLHGGSRLGALVGQPHRLPRSRCPFCGLTCDSVEEHERRECFVLESYGLVYFIEAAGAVKIGFTQRPIDRRFAQIRPSVPHRLHLLLTIAGTRETEASLHRSWRRLRVNGEWFKADPALLRRLAPLQNDPAVVEEKRRFRVDHLDRLPFVPLAETIG